MSYTALRQLPKYAYFFDTGALLSETLSLVQLSWSSSGRHTIRSRPRGYRSLINHTFHQLRLQKNGLEGPDRSKLRLNMLMVDTRNMLGERMNYGPAQTLVKISKQSILYTCHQTDCV